MSATASWLSQVGIVTALRGNAGVTDLLAEAGASVIDVVKEGQLYPYVVVGEGVEKENRFFGQGGHSITVEFYIYTQDGSATIANTGKGGYKQGLAIADAIAAVLQDGSTLTVTSHDVVMVNQLEDWGKERLPDGITRCVIPKFEITLEDS